MSYEQVHAIRFNEDKTAFQIKADSNNVFPKHFHWYMNTKDEPLWIPIHVMIPYFNGGLLQFTVRSEKNLKMLAIIRATGDELKALTGLSPYALEHILSDDFDEANAREQLPFYEGKTEEYYIESANEIRRKIAVWNDPEMRAKIDSIVTEFSRKITGRMESSPKCIVTTDKYDTPQYIYKALKAKLQLTPYKDKAKVFSELKAKEVIQSFSNYSIEYV